MAYVQSTQLNYTQSWVSAALKNIAERFERRAVYKTTVRELSSLTSRELADLGLNASMIKRVAYEAAYK